MKRTYLLFFILWWFIGCNPSTLERIAQQLTLIRMALERVSVEEIKKLRQELDAVKRELAGLREGKPPAERLLRTTIKSHDPIRGNKNAKVVIVEFSDYQCPFCSRWFMQTHPDLQRKYIDTGKVKLVYKDLTLPIHAEADEAANAAHCAGEQGKYWEMHDRIFYNQGLLKNKDVFDSFGSALGLQMPDFRKCMETNRYQKAIQADVQEANALGITGTPSFIIGREVSPGVVEGKLIVGAQPTALFTSELDALLSP